MTRLLPTLLIGAAGILLAAAVATVCAAVDAEQIGVDFRALAVAREINRIAPMVQSVEVEEQHNG